jgi:pSer/pThr/pTyr-binding forkhead associated (FHA) protein
VTRGAEGRQRIFDFAVDEVRVGRDENVEVRLPHPNVSKVHLRLERRDGAVYAVDAGSTNGTTLDGVALEPGQPRALADGDVLQIGGRFELAYYAASPAGVMLTGPKVTADLAQQLVEDLLATGTAGEFADAGGGPELVGREGAAKGRTHRLAAPDSRTVFGRGQSCDVILIDPDLSREHFEVRRTWNGVTITDLGAKNGTHVDERRLPANQAVPVADGAVVRAGGCVFDLIDPAARYLAQLNELVADVPVAAEPEPEPGGPADHDKSWAGRVADPGQIAAAAATPAAPAAPQLDEDSPAAGGHLPLIVLGLVVVGAVAGLVLLLTS